MIDIDRTARNRLGAMVNELWEATGLRCRQVTELGVADRTFRNWRRGTAPSHEHTEKFRSVLHSLQQAAGREFYTEEEWHTALRAAQEEAYRSRDKQLDRPRAHPDRHVVTAADLRKRMRERKVMDAFVGDPSPRAASYLCWYADAPVGKTTLLADYVRRPPADADILSYLVSPTYGTDTRARVETEMAAQIAVLLGTPLPDVPRGVGAWKALFTEAARKSAGRNRRLLLVVDGLDDDAAWSGLAADGGTKEPARRTARGSVAAFLPASPPPGMRIIVSLRRRLRFPDDLPARHPLRGGRNLCLRELLPVEDAPPARRESHHADFNRVVMGLLAVAEGGLRSADLADLTGIPAADLDRRLEGQPGRSFRLDDPVLQTYALADTDLVRSVKTRLGEKGVARHTRALLDWSRRWCAAGWPDGTPPFPLAHQLRLLTGTAERADYVLDHVRLRRLADVFGPDAALAQLDAFEEEVGSAGEVSPAGLAVLVRLAAARAVLRGEPREVPFEAPGLLVRLGEVERARGLARSAPTAAARSAHLADVAVEMARSGRDGAEAVAREAAAWLVNAGPDFPGLHRDPETHARLLGAARELVRLNCHHDARPLLRAVVDDPAAGVEALTEAAGALAEIGDPEINEALCARAESLGAGSVRARAAAVDLWGALGHAVPSLREVAVAHIQTICDELGSSAGLAAVDVMAVSASALFRLRYKRPYARHLIGTARTRITEALADPAALSEADRAHLDRELAGTLARIIQAMHDSDATLGVSAVGEQLLRSLPEDLRVGLLGDDIAGRAAEIVATSVERRKQVTRKWAAEQRAKKNAKRRDYYAQQQGWAKDRRAGNAGRAQQVASPPRQRGSQEPELTASGGPLREAYDHLAAGDLLRSRKSLDDALRSRRASSGQPLVPGNWTVDLAQALGTAGEFSAAEALAEHLPVGPDRARHLAALSLGCSLGGHGLEGRRYAREAARSASGGTEPALAYAVARALAWAGEELAVAGLPDNVQALTAIAAGLVRHRPEEAAGITGPLIEKLTRRNSPGSALRVVPDLAALLLAYPDVRRPDPKLSEALRDAALNLARKPPPRHAPSTAVISLLTRLGLLSEEDTHVVTAETDTWRHSHRSGQTPCGELAVLFAMDGDTAALDRLVKAARTPDAQTAILSAAAAYFAGVPVAPTVARAAAHRVVRTCLALTRATETEAPPAEAPARTFTQRLLKTGGWPPTIPLLPTLAPDSLTPLATLTGHMLKLRDAGWVGRGPLVSGRLR
ncbi:hypothetical protein [Actinocorallia sp. A-T 12471]|uniref:hypothetical protein n=1 Tax=Actinocorallia sp. A-T 12471 TaxID=3089813 RepID=UPI0029CDE237|nr:hypothetical protein [Actinocorallia sp. A-T 12471]MDX6741535.1 hypothetical protein [Actinocorallia sp. A-T 12471]